MKKQTMTLCKDDSCPMNKACYRFIESDSEEWQSVFKTSPRRGYECEYQIK